LTSLLRRLALVPLTLIGITLVTFALLHALPGDAATLQAGTARGVSAETLQSMRHQYGFDRPLWAQYGDWLSRSARFDFGDSLTDGRPVRAKIAAALPTTLLLALLATVLAFGVAVPLGAALGFFDRSRWARGTSAALYAIYALPGAAVALLVLRAGAPFGAHTIVGMLPAAACLALAETVKLARYQRTAVVVELAADYVTAARARGAGPLGVVAHALRNALLPMVTLLGAEVPALLGMSVIVEQVFGLHGIGLMAFDAVLTRDVPLLLALTTVGAVATLAGVLFADVAYGLVDPRLRGRAT
jgi:peptide/nickel transport system permease protein